MNIIKKIKNFFNFFYKHHHCSPTVISRAEHHISRKNINKNVLKVLYRLKEHGYKSYLVGGGVRDLLLNKKPKDFDVVTNAYPEKIRKLFKNCYIIGRRFQLIHVHFGKEIVEVATFRAGHTCRDYHSKEGMILRDNVYGNIEQDALRRDFTINALYYNIANYTLVDYVDGLKDLNAKRLCLIGDPITRYREDPVRILRAIRFAAKLGFTIHYKTEEPISSLKSLLFNIAPARLYEEYIKLFFYGHALVSFELLKQYEILEILFSIKKINININFIIEGLKDVDYKFSEGQKIDPAWPIAILLWCEVRELAAKYKITEKNSEFLAYKHAAEKLLMEQNKIISLSKKLMIVIKDIWTFQIKLIKITGKSEKRINKLNSSPKFKAAFEFLSLRAAVGDKKAQKIVGWWNRYLLAAKTMIQNGDNIETC